MSRLITADPVGINGAASSSRPWNQYAYALTDPVVLVDPDGRAPLSPQLIEQVGRDCPECVTPTEAFLRIQRYGKYGGYRWTGGQLDGTDTSVRAVDVLDAAYREHDIAYMNCAATGGAMAYYEQADRALIDRLGGIQILDLGVYANLHKQAAGWVFTAFLIARSPFILFSRNTTRPDPEAGIPHALGHFKINGRDPFQVYVRPEIFWCPRGGCH